MSRASIKAELVDFGIAVVAEVMVVAFVAVLLGVAFMRERARGQA